MNLRSLTVLVCAVVSLLPGQGTATAADIHVPDGGDLQAAINAARPGDTILLAPGATFVGNFVLPVHGGTTYITIRSAAADTLLPPAGTRISPAYAPYLPKIHSPNTSPALRTMPGAAYWRLMLLEFGPTWRGYYDIVVLGDGSGAQNSLAQVPHDLVLDRLYLRGDPIHGQKRGVALNAGRTTLMNSYIVDMKAVAQDSQATGGWNGPGPYTIENNYMEAAGEVIMIGGSDPHVPDLVPSDIVIRRNTLTRPLSWRDPFVPRPSGVGVLSSAGGWLPPGSYSYRVVARRYAGSEEAYSPASTAAVATLASAGRVTVTWSAVPHATLYDVYATSSNGMARYWTTSSTIFVHDGSNAGSEGQAPSWATRWSVKNLLELKNARRVRIEDNLLEYNWAAAQTGEAVLFTPRNQDGRCGWCVVEDVTFERNVVRGTGGGVVVMGWDDEKPSQQGNGFVIRNNVFSDMGHAWGGSGHFLALANRPRNLLVDHNTVISQSGNGVLAIDGNPVSGLVFTNNVAIHHLYGIFGSGYAPGMDTIAALVPDAVITRNVFAAPPYPYAYPAGNEFPSAAEFESHFVDYAQGNYMLKEGTDWANAGTDGLDLGAHLTPQDEAPRPPRAPRNIRFKH